MFQNQYKKRKVLVTGHTGFKGSWLCYWLNMLGAEVCGISLPPHTQPSHFNLLNLDLESHFSDLRDLESLQKIFTGFRPELVFHLAAQPLVLKSYTVPVETFETNVMGTVHVLEAIRHTDSVRGAVIISSDKCYENREWTRGYREEDPMGGYDPYSASKGCTELVVSSYRRSFFNNDSYGQAHHTLIASARAGNVIGGGDWADDRLVPDLMRAASEGRASGLRSPDATRPWQHVLEPLSGYLQLGQNLLKCNVASATGWNFGPDQTGMITVEFVAKELACYWDAIRLYPTPPAKFPHEAKLLTLDCTKAANDLKWHGTWSPSDALRYTAEWYRAYYTEGVLHTAGDLQDYIRTAMTKGLSWTE